MPNGDILTVRCLSPSSSQVLQSDFLRAVRDVYEHMYETVDVEGSPEVRASATAKATVAAFAASEGEEGLRVGGCDRDGVGDIMGVGI